MNRDIAELLKSKLITSSYAERIAGLTRTVVVKVKDRSGSAVSRKIPMGCGIENPENCPPSQLIVPDNSLSSLVWFEDMGVIMLSEEGRVFHFLSSLKLIVWLNLNRYEHDCSITAAVSMDVVRRLMTGYENMPNYQSIRVKNINLLPKEISVFAAYDFENKNMYSMYPYEYIAFKIETEFAVNKNCLKTIQIKDAECRTASI